MHWSYIFFALTHWDDNRGNVQYSQHRNIPSYSGGIAYIIFLIILNNTQGAARLVEISLAIFNLPFGQKCDSKAVTSKEILCKHFNFVVITVPANGLALFYARLSADTVMTKFVFHIQYVGLALKELTTTHENWAHNPYMDGSPQKRSNSHVNALELHIFNVN